MFQRQRTCSRGNTLSLSKSPHSQAWQAWQSQSLGQHPQVIISKSSEHTVLQLSGCLTAGIQLLQRLTDLCQCLRVIMSGRA